MALDWTVLVATTLGAGIGLAGDWTGRRSERRQRARLRADAIEDATREREWRIDEQRQHELEQRQLARLQTPAHTGVRAVHAAGDDIDSNEFRERLIETVGVMAVEGKQIVQLGLFWRPPPRAHRSSPRDCGPWERVPGTSIA